MVTVAADCRRVDEVTLVECRLTNTEDEPTRVRIESRLDGPTWPPRDGPYPERGWTDDAWTGRLAAGTTLGIGFASSAPPVEPPVRVEELEALSDAGERFAGDPTPADVVRELPDPRPPQDGLFDATDATGRTTDDKPSERPTDLQPGLDQTEAWLDDVTDRVERLEALDAACTLPEATVAVADADGLDGVRALCATMREDRDRLLDLATRAERLAGRIEAADVPVETLERLA